MSEPVTRTFLVVDVEKSSDRGNEELALLRRQLYSMLNKAMSAAELMGGKAAVEDRGDGFLVVADASVLDVLVSLTDTLVDELTRYNATVVPTDWLRLRIAVHSGLVHRDFRGWSGEELTRTFRICDAPEAKLTLEAAQRGQAVVIVSDHVYETVVKHRYRGLPRDSFREIRSGFAWARVPGYSSPPVPQPPAEPGPPPSSPPGVSGGNLDLSQATVGTLISGSSIDRVDARSRFGGKRHE
ncbi:hypothetical protein SAMN05216188_10963 [Lentzea xinjiangensis]|uniref:Guanylate cyclase domain-containing protein n=1 Tax=Lentzea xinjiangensis TaxID=402600 RepID=A0A1H9MH79_9PSEU|nr:hypothetical protein [Lentzea xinjiangensis]SER23070.1 hypothetical protein SAMN05216188_10963 [Lentzea xinjiangensis]